MIRYHYHIPYSFKYNNVFRGKKEMDAIVALLIFANKQIQTLSGKTSSMIVKKLENGGLNTHVFCSKICVFLTIISFFCWGKEML